MKKTLLGLAAAASLATIASVTMPTKADAQVFVYEGARYCFYFDGWHGPGWYRCGYRFRTGLGWGGVYGWHGWRHAGWERRHHGADVNVRIRSGEREGITTRSRTVIRSGEGPTVRGGATVRTGEGVTTRSRTTIRSGASTQGGGSATVQGGGQMRSTTGQGGPSMRGGVQGGASGGAKMNVAPSGGGAAAGGKASGGASGGAAIGGGGKQQQ